MYALTFDKNGMKDVCSKEDFELVIDKNLIQQIDQTEKYKESQNKPNKNPTNIHCSLQLTALIIKSYLTM